MFLIRHVSSGSHLRQISPGLRPFSDAKDYEENVIWVLWMNFLPLAHVDARQRRAEGRGRAVQHKSLLKSIILIIVQIEIASFFQKKCSPTRSTCINWHCWRQTGMYSHTLIPGWATLYALCTVSGPQLSYMKKEINCICLTYLGGLWET